MILNTFGAYLRQKDGMFQVETEGKKAELAPARIERILITTAVSLTSDALLLALQHNIDVVFLDKYGEPQARLWHSRPGSTITIKRRQLAISAAAEGLALALEWVKQKVGNQADFLGELAANREGEKREKLLEKQEFINRMLPAFDVIEGTIDEQRGTVMGNEGVCGRAYFEALSLVMPSAWVFNGRSHRPAQDYFNAFLNYAYGVLYSLVERAILIAGLDPYTGFIHADNYNKTSLVFDLIERYRITAEKTVTLLFTGKKVNNDCCRTIPGGFLLDKPGKELLLRSLNERLDAVVHYKQKNHKVRDIIQLDCHELAQRLLKGE